MCEQTIRLEQLLVPRLSSRGLSLLKSAFEAESMRGTEALGGSGGRPSGPAATARGTDAWLDTLMWMLLLMMMMLPPPLLLLPGVRRITLAGRRMQQGRRLALAMPCTAASQLACKDEHWQKCQPTPLTPVHPTPLVPVHAAHASTRLRRRYRLQCCLTLHMLSNCPVW